MDRFQLFGQLKQFIEYTASHFKELPFNPFDTFVSPLYLNMLQCNEDSSIKSTRINAKIREWMERGKESISIRKSNLENYYASLQSWPKDIKKPILFLPVEPTHVQQFQPVWLRLADQGIPYLIATNRYELYTNLSATQPTIWLNKKNNSKKNEVVVRLKTICETVVKSYEKICSEEFFWYLNKAKIVIVNHLVWMMDLNTNLNLILDVYQPKNVVVGYDITAEGRMLTHLSKLRKVLSFCIMHGSITGEPLDTLHIVDSFLLYGEAAKKDLANKGLPLKMLNITGAPYMDKIINEKKIIHPVLIKKLGLTETKPYLLVATSGPGHSTSWKHFELMIENIFKLSVENPGLQLVIKLHRKDRLVNYTAINNKFPSNKIKIISSNQKNYPQSVFEWIQGATALLTGTSTTAIEAMYMKVPVITMDFNNEYKMVDFIDEGTTIHATNYTELKNAVHNLIEKPEYYTSIFQKSNKYAQNYFYREEGKTASEIITNILNQKTQP